MNKATLVGWIGKKRELKETENSCVLNFSVATRKDYKERGQWAKGSDYTQCVVWGKRAQWVDKAEEGTPIAIEGRNVTRSYEKDGRKVWVSEVLVLGMEMFAKAPGATYTDTVPEDAPQPEGNDLAF